MKKRRIMICADEHEKGGMSPNTQSVAARDPRGEKTVMREGGV